MRTLDLGEVEAQLSRLLDQAASGEPFIIARAGRPLVRVMPLEARTDHVPPIGFMAGRISVPEDFDAMGADAIERLFHHR